MNTVTKQRISRSFWFVIDPFTKRFPLINAKRVYINSLYQVIVFSEMWYSCKRFFMFKYLVVSALFADTFAV